ncbi:MAG: HAD family hydrolase [Chloroflexi bacterium]|nr:HAD family hydrolase [Chloroflexota bacterium]
MRPAHLPAPDQIEAILFDLDDTLVDARGSWRAGLAEALAELHARSPALQALGSPTAIYDGSFRHYSEDAHRAAGFGEWQASFTVEAFERLVAEHLGPDPALAAQLVARYQAATPGHLAIFPDAEPLLERLGARYPLGLISNGPGPLQRPKIEKFSLERHFEVVVVSGEFGVRKPDQRIFASTLEALGASAANAVFIGDNPTDDIAGACASGLSAIWVNRGDWPAPDPDNKAALPHAEVRELREIAAVLGLEGR